MTNFERHDMDDPAPDARVAAVLAAAGAPVEPGPQPGEQAALAAFRAVHHRAGRPRMLSTLVPLKTAVAALAGAGVLMTGGVAAAATTGSLPGAAQDTAAQVLSEIGITVPGANDHANGHADQRGSSADHKPATAGQSGTAQHDANEPAGTGQSAQDQSAQGQSGESADHKGQGSKISGLATTTDSTGVDKGAEISSQASGGKSQAGQDHPSGDQSQAGSEHSQAGQDHPSGDQNQKGTQASGDHSQAGDQHPTAQQHQPEAAQGSSASSAGQSKAADASSGRSSSATRPGTSQRP